MLSTLYTGAIKEIKERRTRHCHSPATAVAFTSGPSSCADWCELRKEQELVVKAKEQGLSACAFARPVLPAEREQIYPPIVSFSSTILVTHYTTPAKKKKPQSHVGSTQKNKTFFGTEMNNVLHLFNTSPKRLAQHELIWDSSGGRGRGRGRGEAGGGGVLCVIARPLKPLESPSTMLAHSKSCKLDTLQICRQEHEAMLCVLDVARNFSAAIAFHGAKGALALSGAALMV